MNSISLGALLGTLAVGLGSCGDRLAGPGDGGRFHARISGDATAVYEGTASFAQGGGTSGVPRYVTVISSGISASAGQTLFLWTRQDGRPQMGSYPFALPNDSSPRWLGFAGEYERIVNDVSEIYLADSGALTITDSSPGTLAGTFRMSAFLLCTRPNAAPFEGRSSGDCSVRNPSPAGPTIIIEGSFTAQPDTAKGVFAW
jgi:hypothetical protein